VTMRSELVEVRREVLKKAERKRKREMKEVESRRIVEEEL